MNLGKFRGKLFKLKSGTFFLDALLYVASFVKLISDFSIAPSLLSSLFVEGGQYLRSARFGGIGAETRKGPK